MIVSIIVLTRLLVPLLLRIRQQYATANQVELASLQM
jgi:hypothetical protein